MQSISHFIIDRWRIIVALALGISALAVAGILSPNGMSEMSEAKTAYKLKSELDVEFGSDGGDCVIVVDVVDLGGDLFEAERLRIINEMERDVEALEFVEEVMSPGDIKTVNWLGLPSSLMPSPGAGAEALAKAKGRAVDHSLGRQLFSEDGRTLILPVLFTREAMNRYYGEKVTAVRAVVDGYGERDGLRVRLTGLFPLWDAEREAGNRDRIKFIVIGYVLTAALAIYLFRSLWVTAAIGLPAFIGLFWSIGILAFFNERPTPLTQLVMPMMLTMVGFTDAVHLMFHIRRARWAGESRAAAAKSAVRELGVACGLTSLTTAIGFGSLLLAEAEVIRSFGLACAIGVVLTFSAVVTLVPLLSLTRLGKNVHLSHEHDFMEKHRPWAQRAVGFLLRHARPIVVASALLMVLFAAASATLRPDNRFLSRMPDRSDAYLAMAHVDRHLDGTQVMRISLDWDPGALDEAALVEKLAGVHAILEGEELLGFPLSLCSILESLPGRGGDLAGRFGQLRWIPDKVRNGFYRPDLRSAIVACRVQDRGIAVYKPVFDRVDAALEKLESPGVRLVMTGDPIIWGRYLDRMVTDLLKSLALASVIILVVMGLVYRSVRVGLIAIVPNLFPLAATGAMLAILKIPLEIETVCAFTICLGIAVDDTIHFLSRYKHEICRHDCDTAIRETFIRVGSPLMVTTTLMVTGFATSQWSELPNFRMFGAMACATLAAAFVADLLILPALLKVFGRHAMDR